MPCDSSRELHCPSHARTLNQCTFLVPPFFFSETLLKLIIKELVTHVLMFRNLGIIYMNTDRQRHIIFDYLTKTTRFNLALLHFDFLNKPCFKIKCPSLPACFRPYWHYSRSFITLRGIHRNQGAGSRKFPHQEAPVQMPKSRQRRNKAAFPVHDRDYHLNDDEC